MRNQKKVFMLLIVMAAWLLLMWKLSTANGTETLRDSMVFARKIGGWIYDTPTAEQLNHLNLFLRKMAHVFLYAVLGCIFAMLWQLLLERYAMWKRMLPPILCCIAVAFLDELQKIPIAGRHFSCSESFLNAGSALAVILIFYFCVWICTKNDRKQETSL